jgi:hypothetical protein
MVMKIDNWTRFNLTAEDRQLIDAYSGPTNEASILKDIPIQCLDLALPTIRRIQALSGRRCRVVYRGPRRSRYQSTTHRADALRFAVYFR